METRYSWLVLRDSLALTLLMLEPALDFPGVKKLVPAVQEAFLVPLASSFPALPSFPFWGRSSVTFLFFFACSSGISSSLRMTARVLESSGELPLAGGGKLAGEALEDDEDEIVCKGLCAPTSKSIACGNSGASKSCCFCLCCCSCC